MGKKATGPAAAAAADIAVMPFASQGAWGAWLELNHARDEGVWVKFAKKDSGVPTVVYAEALEVALCFGWIDGQVKRFDERYYLQRFTPRRARSKWSKINCAKANDLIARGAMRPAGLRQVEAAKADGRWDAAYDGMRTATVPADLAAELAKSKRAAKSFAGLSAQNRYAILYRLHEAKRPETRVRRLTQILEMLKKGETFHP